jgi:hypothetical protein
VKLSRLSRGEAIAALSALALFVLMFFDWYGFEEKAGSLGSKSIFGGPESAWQALEVGSWILLLVVLVAIGSALLRVIGSKWEPAIPPSAAVAVLGGLATLLSLLRILLPPEIVDIPEAPVSTTVELAAYLALAAVAGIAYGGYRAMGERGTSFAKVADALSAPRRARPRRRPETSPRSPERPSSRRRSRSSSD